MFISINKNGNREWNLIEYKRFLMSIILTEKDGRLVEEMNLFYFYDSPQLCVCEILRKDYV